MQNLKRSAFLIFLTCSLLVSASVFAEIDSIDVLRPSASQSKNRVNDSGGRAAKAYLNRQGAVSFSAEKFLPRSKPAGKRGVPSQSFRGRSLGLSFFSGQKFQVKVDSDARPKHNIISLNGHLAGRDLATFSLTVTPESFIITLQDLDAARVYRVVGDTETGEGRVQEIDMKKMPPMKHLPPRIPPEN